MQCGQNKSVIKEQFLCRFQTSAEIIPRSGEMVQANGCWQATHQIIPSTAVFRTQIRS